MIDHQKFNRNGLSIYRIDDVPYYVLHKSPEMTPSDKRFIAAALKDKLDRFADVPLVSVLAQISENFVTSDYRDATATLTHRETLISAYKRDGDGSLKTWRYAPNECVIMVLP